MSAELLARIRAIATEGKMGAIEAHRLDVHDLWCAIDALTEVVQAQASTISHMEGWIGELQARTA